MAPATALHPQAESFLDAASGPPPQALSVAATRREFADLLRTDDPPPVAAVRDLSIPGPGGPLPLRVYAPEADGPRPVAVYCHGGGWVRGGLDTHDEYCRSLTRDSGCVVVAVDYRRPPEHPFPAPLEDAYAAVEWVADYADTFGGDPDRIAVGGDSAGGNLAAATALLARDRDGPAVAHQFLLYPVLDATFDTGSYEAFAEGYLPTRETMRWYWDQYLDDPVDAANPYAAPLRARDVAGLPSATVLTAGFDPLRDEGRAYADRLREAGTSVAHTEYEDMIHGFLSFPDEIDRATEGRSEVADAVRAALGG